MLVTGLPLLALLCYWKVLNCMPIEKEAQASVVLFRFGVGKSMMFIVLKFIHTYKCMNIQNIALPIEININYF